MKRTIPRRGLIKPSIVVDPEVMSGEPVFSGTRVPVKSLFQHLEANCTLDEFLEWFPTVSRETAAAVLMAAHELTDKKARR